MVSGDTVDRMVDGADDLFEVRPDPTEQAIEPAPTSARGAIREIAPKQDFMAAKYGSKLGKKTLAQYYFTYLIPEGVGLRPPRALGLLKPRAGALHYMSRAL